MNILSNNRREIARILERKGQYFQSLMVLLDLSKSVVAHLWNYDINNKVRSIINVDINNDNAIETIIGSESNWIYVLNSNGKELWRKETNAWVLGVGVIKNEKGEILVLAGAETLYCFDACGNTIVHNADVKTDITAIWSDISVDFFITGHNDGTVKKWNTNLEIVGEFKTYKQIICLNAKDIDGDGDDEIIVGSEDMKIHILDNNMMNLKDIVHLNHWIFSISTFTYEDTKLNKLFIATFGGEINLYTHLKNKENRSFKLNSHGVLSICVKNIISGREPQIIVGSSDLQVSIINIEANELIWQFNTGFGHRVIDVVKTKDNDCTLYVGADLGAIHAYKLNLDPTLAKDIVSLCDRLQIKNPSHLGIEEKYRIIIKDLYSSDPVEYDASIEKIHFLIRENKKERAIILLMEIWWSGIEVLWVKDTGGRIYSIASREDEVFVGSDDSKLYCLDSHDGKENWCFETRGGVRGVDVKSNGDIIIGSTDNNVYCLRKEGIPIWNFDVDSWVLITKCTDIKEDGRYEVIIGTEDNNIYAISNYGLILWKFSTLDRVRSITLCDIDNDSNVEIIAGSDDKYVYVLDINGCLKTKFKVPHFVLVIKAIDINGDGISEILLGAEDGYLYCFSNQGDLIWKFRTGHWIAALDTFTNKNNEIEIVVGSADRYLYGLDRNGKLLWRYETASRVRTLHIAMENNNICIYFGSYNNKVHKIRLIEYNNILIEIKKLQDDKKFALQVKNKTDKRLNAFAYMNIKNEEELIKLIHEEDGLCKAVLGVKYVNSIDNYDDEMIEFLINDKDQTVRLKIFQALEKKYSIKYLQTLFERINIVSEETKMEIEKIIK